MKSQRGTTLIEVMITVAMLGITAEVVISQISRATERAADMVRRERGLQLLELEADALSRGVAPDAATAASLLEVVPEGKLDVRKTAGQATITVSFATARGHRESRSLTVVTP